MTAAQLVQAGGRSVESANSLEGASCNTPPLNTQTIQIPQQNRILIDWFEFTLPDDFLVRGRYHTLKHRLRIEGASFRSAPRGMHGYKSQLIYGNARILLGGSEGMGVHVILSGEAIRQMSGDLLKLVDWVLHHEGKISRIDLALDDVTGELSLDRVKRTVRAGAVSCRAKTYRRMESGSLSTGTVTGETFYFGSAQSRTQYRIYDKAAEQNTDGHWVRCEGQYRNENAHNVALMIRESGFNIGPVFCGLLRGYLSFLTPSKTDSNKARWKTAQWWLDLLHGAEKLKLSILKAAPSLERMKNWFVKQVAPTFATLLNAYGAEPMQEIYRLGKARMTEEQRQLCAIPF